MNLDTILDTIRNLALVTNLTDNGVNEGQSLIIDLSNDAFEEDSLDFTSEGKETWGKIVGLLSPVGISFFDYEANAGDVSHIFSVESGVSTEESAAAFSLSPSEAWDRYVGDTTAEQWAGSGADPRAYCGLDGADTSPLVESLSKPAREHVAGLLAVWVAKH